MGIRKITCQYRALRLIGSQQPSAKPALQQTLCLTVFPQHLHPVQWRRPSQKHLLRQIHRLLWRVTPRCQQSIRLNSPLQPLSARAQHCQLGVTPDPQPLLLSAEAQR